MMLLTLYIEARLAIPQEFSRRACGPIAQQFHKVYLLGLERVT